MRNLFWHPSLFCILILQKFGVFEKLLSGIRRQIQIRTEQTVFGRIRRNRNTVGFRACEQIINRYVKIVCNLKQTFVVRLLSFCLISRDCGAGKF